MTAANEVGIGTNNPNAKLDIRQTLGVDNVTTHLLAGYSGGTNNRSIAIQQIGMALLLMLMITVIMQDITRLFN